MSSFQQVAAPVDASFSPRSRTSVAGGERWFEALVLLAYLALIILVSARHEPWGDETQTWRMAIDTNGLVDLYRAARYEGHPLLFHVLLQWLGHISRSWWAPVALHVAIAGAAAWLVLRYAPFTRLQKALLIFGYFPAYEYAVIVRPYGLGMMLGFAACVAWTAAPRRTVWTVVLLVLLANTTVMGTLLALTLALTFATDWLWPDGAPPRLSMRKLAPAALVAVAALGVLWFVNMQVQPPPDAGFVVKPKVDASRFSLWNIGSMPTVELRALFPVSMVQDGVVQWRHWLFRPETSLDLGLLLLAAAIVLCVGCLIAARRRAALAFFLVGTTGFLVFFNFLLGGTTRHHGSLFIVWVLTAWLAWTGRQSEWPRIPRVGAGAEAIGRRLFTCSLVIPVVATVQYVVSDLRGPFADARRVAAVVREQGLERVPIIGLSRLLAQPVGALLDRKVLYPVEGQTLSFIEWGRGASHRRSVRATDSIATDLLARECRVLVITAATNEVLPSTASRGRAIYTTPRPPITGDRYRVWLLSAPASERCRTADR
jgi:hypothetical protein